MINTDNKIVIAIDGYSSCGKSTVAKEVAKLLNYIYIDTGAMYRAVTLYCLRNNIISNGIVDITQLKKQIDEIIVMFRYNQTTDHNDIWLNGENVEEEIRQLPVSQNVSQVAAVADVRRLLVSLQQEMGKRKGIVMDGRDIGTVVFPDAELKIFMTAGADIRAQRRYDELIAKNEEVSYEEIMANITSRDRYDETREESPLRKADNALILDNSYMSRVEQLQWVLKKVEKFNNNVR